MTWLVLCLAVVLLGASIVIRQRLGLPWRRIVYDDTGRWRQATEPLFARRYGLVGKPDYLFAVGRQLMPVEVKPGRVSQKPYPSDIMQLAAYCLLVEETFGTRPPYGVLRYARTTFRIPFDERLRDELIDLLDEMQLADPEYSARRSHRERRRCRGCGFRTLCDEALT